ncbi:hypothetical protein CEXT_265821 [Caerostris extrusa]|uniref:Uncharacterized protein n=1 Tax=Caerostris extrusa TaxID=172846 RepID=A0AAV4PCU1_CAEEX|nr:hypothetical protein CEXT_265821 [Caerostris extrusa]
MTILPVGIEHRTDSETSDALWLPHLSSRTEMRNMYQGLPVTEETLSSHTRLATEFILDHAIPKPYNRKTAPSIK